jgi:hypothetical protein
MALTKEQLIDKIEIVENGIMQVRQVTKIMEDGTELSKTYHRTSLTPGQDLAEHPANVVAICNVVWTEEIIVAYQAQQLANQIGN